VVLFKKSELAGSTLCGIEGASDVDVAEVYVSSTTWTTDIGGQLTVMHTATTIPWADAPSSVTATATATTSGKGGSSSSGASAIGAPARYAMLVVATAFLVGCFL
jgi:hypothetical protein